MRGYFIFNDCCSNDIGLLKDKPLISRAKRNVKHIEIEGRDGTLTEDLGTYSDIDIKMSLVTKKNVWENEKLFSIFDGRGGQLKLSWLPGNITVKEVSAFSIKQEKQTYTIELTFICGPFRELEENTLIITNNNTSIFIPGTQKTNHITKIYGNGNINLFINEEQIIFKDVVDYIEIDTNRLICYKGSTSLNNKMIGEFVNLNSGENIISWIGNVIKIETAFKGRFLA